MRATQRVISGPLAWLLAPFALLAAIVAAVLPGKKTIDRTPEDVAGFIRDFINGEGGDWDWDEFESIPITDPALDKIRDEAVLVGPPNANLERLAELAAQAEGMVADRPFLTSRPL